MDIDEKIAAELDASLFEYADILRGSGDDVAAVTLAYTHSVQRAWRTALRMLPVPAQWSVLDVGCGVGVLGFDLATNLPIFVQGIDINPGFVEHAKAIVERLDARGLFKEGANLRFDQGDIMSLTFEDESFDLVFVRETMQFLPEPELATKELFRVIRPGGYLCASETDDQLRITWPPPSPEFERLVGSVTAVHNEKGGDRYTGRKLSTYMSNQGFEITSVVVLPEANHRRVDSADTERELIFEQHRAARSRVVEAGAMAGDSYDADLAALMNQEPYEEFRMNARIIVLGRRPPA